MIKKFLMGSVALAALTGTALAADLPSRRAPPVFVPPPPVFSWTGFYVGGQLGYQFGQDSFGGATAHPHGVAGGAHIGYNWAGWPGFGVGNGLVLGAEVDINGTDYQVTNGISTLRQDVEGSARGRIGVAVDRALFFATGGAAFTQFHSYYPAFVAASKSRVGWTVGGGVEYAITTQWSLRAEYRYSDFGTFFDGVGTRRETVQRAQVGFSYKFDTIAPTPVVARY
jgi:outer membrane immunogenic protein